jgi:hypothetical protein
MNWKLLLRRLSATYFILWGMWELYIAGEFHGGWTRAIGVLLIVSGVGQAVGLHIEKKKAETTHEKQENQVDSHIDPS